MFRSLAQCPRSVQDRLPFGKTGQASNTDWLAIKYSQIRVRGVSGKSPQTYGTYVFKNKHAAREATIFKYESIE